MASTPLPPLVLRAQSLSVNNLNEDYVFPELGEVTGLAVTNGSSASILLPQELLSSRGMGKYILDFYKLQALPGQYPPTESGSLVPSSSTHMGKERLGAIDAKPGPLKKWSNAHERRHANLCYCQNGSLTEDIYGGTLSVIYKHRGT